MVSYQPWEVLTDAPLSALRLRGQHRSVRSYQGRYQVGPRPTSSKDCCRGPGRPSAPRLPSRPECRGDQTMLALRRIWTTSGEVSDRHQLEPWTPSPAITADPQEHSRARTSKSATSIPDALLKLKARSFGRRAAS